MKILKHLFRTHFFIFLLAFSACQNDDAESLLPQVEISDLENGDLIPNQYIVELHTDAANEEELAQAGAADARKDIMALRANRLFSRVGARKAELLGSYSGALRGFFARLSDEDLAVLRDDPEVKRILPDRLYRLPIFEELEQILSEQQIPWGVERVGGPADGSGKTAWIIDSGIDLEHPDLLVDESRSRAFLSGIGLFETPDDRNGHGTHVAGTVAALDNDFGVVGVAAGATVVSVRVLNRFGSGSWSNIIEGMDYVAQVGAPGDVCNMSLGGAADELIDDALRQAATSGVIFCVAAGNESQNIENVSPARVDAPNVYTVSAMDDADAFASFSNFGLGVDYCAPGVDIGSTWRNETYRRISGTSMAAPHLAGLLLLDPTPATDGFVENDPDGQPDPIAVKE